MGNTDPSWLWPGEQIVYWARQSCRQALIIALAMAGAAAVTSFSLAAFKGDDPKTVLLVSAIIPALTLGLPHFVTSYRRFEFVLTSHRIFYRSGIFRRKSGEIAVAQIVDIKGPKTGDHPFELKLAGGKSLNVYGLPDLGRLRETLAKAIGAA